MKTMQSVGRSVLFVAAALVFSSAGAASMVRLDFPGAHTTTPYGVDGTTIVGTYSTTFLGREHGFIYDGREWTALDYPGARESGFFDIDAGRLVGAYSDESGSHGFVYDGETWTSLHYPRAKWTSAFSIEGDRILGFYGASSRDMHSFLYDGSTYTPLDHPNGTKTYAAALDGGRVAGTYRDRDGVMHGFVYDGTTWTDVDLPDRVPGVIYGADAGRLVGALHLPGNDWENTHAVLHDGADWQFLPLGPDVRESFALGIDGDTIVGSASSVSGDLFGFVYTIPEPATGLLLLAGLTLSRRR